MYNSGIGTPYWFEWEIGILECLNMLQDTSIESVILQSTDFQALDDVVVNYSDKSILSRLITIGMQMYILGRCYGHF